MIASTQHQSWLFFLPLAQQVALLKDDLLEAVDPLLDDPELIELVRQCLATRRPPSTRTGRPGIAPDRLLRCCVLKHMKRSCQSGFFAVAHRRSLRIILYTGAVLVAATTLTVGVGLIRSR